MPSTLKEIRERAEKASPKPWEQLKAESIVGHYKQVEAVHQEGAFDWICSMQISNSPNFRNDSNFIAHARQDIPYLLQLVGRMRDMIFELQRQVHADNCGAYCCEICDKAEALLSDTEKE